MPARCLALLLLLPIVGCASTAEDEESERIVRFAVLAAPSAGGEGGVLGEDLLMEVVDQLSVDTALDFCLVPGPLVLDESLEAREGLIGGLGSLAPQVYPALAPSDGPRRELLEAFEETLAGHKGEAGYKGKRVGALRPVVRDPEAEGQPGILVKVTAGLPILVQSGPELILTREEGQARLVLPPLTQPPHLYAIATYQGGQLSIQLRSALELPVPPAPAPLTLK